jgi:hypothetical protein
MKPTGSILASFPPFKRKRVIKTVKDKKTGQPVKKRTNVNVPDARLSPGRFGAGVRQEDIDFLIKSYEDAVKWGNASEGEPLPMTKYIFFALQQMAGLPARDPGENMEKIIFNEQTKKRVENMLNTGQSMYNFEWVELPDDQKHFGLIVRKVRKVGHARRGLLDI